MTDIEKSFTLLLKRASAQFQKTPFEGCVSVTVTGDEEIIRAKCGDLEYTLLDHDAFGHGSVHVDYRQNKDNSYTVDLTWNIEIPNPFD